MNVELAHAGEGVEDGEEVDWRSSIGRLRKFTRPWDFSTG